MLLKEAQRILKENGYRLIEAYDAVTDHNHTKSRGLDDFHGRARLGIAYTENLIRALREEGIECGIHYMDNINIENKLIVTHTTCGACDYVGDDDSSEYEIGSESNIHSRIKSTEDEIELNIYDKEDIDRRRWNRPIVKNKRMDIRNIPGAVKFIINVLNNYKD